MKRDQIAISIKSFWETKLNNLVFFSRIFHYKSYTIKALRVDIGPSPKPKQRLELRNKLSRVGVGVGGCVAGWIKWK